MPSGGPGLPPHLHSHDSELTVVPTVGPELPPHLQPRPKQGPSFPSGGPELPAKRKRSSTDEDNGNSSPPTKMRAASPPRRVLGPAPPPIPLDEKPLQSGQNDDSSDDDDYAPPLPPPAGSATAYQEQADREAAESAAIKKERTAKPKREEWMLVPPSDSDWGSRIDPTKLKNRKFASGKGAKASAEKSGISAIWTETPEEKRQRLEDEVMGRKDVSASSVRIKEGRKDDAESEATTKRIQDHNEKNRATSLYNKHKSQVPREKEDDPSARCFDKGKDMALGGRVGYVQKRDMLKKAGDFGSRFERGSYL